MRNIITNSNQIVDISVFKDSYTRSVHNYFIGDNIALRLYKPKVSWLDKSTISFGFNKYESSTLLKLIKNIQDEILTKLKLYKEEYGFSDDILPNPMYFEKGESFYIKCSLPNRNGKYLIDYYNLNDVSDKVFNIPLIGCVYDSVIIDIRNIFEDTCKNKSGFHLELKQVWNTF